MTDLRQQILSLPDGEREMATGGLRYQVLQRLHEAIDKSGLTQVQLARRLGVRKSAVSEVLRGNGNLRINTLAEYLFETGCTAEIVISPLAEPHDHPPSHSPASLTWEPQKVVRKIPRPLTVPGTKRVLDTKPFMSLPVEKAEVRSA